MQQTSAAKTGSWIETQPWSPHHKLHYSAMSPQRNFLKVLVDCICFNPSVKMTHHSELFWSYRWLTSKQFDVERDGNMIFQLFFIFPSASCQMLIRCCRDLFQLLLLLSPGVSLDGPRLLQWGQIGCNWIVLFIWGVLMSQFILPLKESHYFKQWTWIVDGCQTQMWKNEFIYDSFWVCIINKGKGSKWLLKNRWKKTTHFNLSDCSQEPLNMPFTLC